VTEKLRATVIREGDIKIDEEEVKQAFDQDKQEYGVPARLHLQQIYINPSKIGGTRAEKEKLAREKAEQALARLMSGQSFEGVARSMSDAPGAESGGDMGMLPAGALPPFLVNAAASMKPGDVSEIIQSEFGLHIVKLLGYEAPVDANFEETARVVRNALLSERGAKVVHEFCDNLVKNGAEVEVYLELEKNLVLNGVLPAG
jgi:parvulin-like peptidyl-prolyl isomerase